MKITAFLVGVLLLASDLPCFAEGAPAEKSGQTKITGGNGAWFTIVPHPDPVKVVQGFYSIMYGDRLKATPPTRETFFWHCPTQGNTSSSCANLAASLLPSCGFHREGNTAGPKDYCQISSKGSIWACMADAKNCSVSYVSCPADSSTEVGGKAAARSFSNPYSATMSAEPEPVRICMDKPKPAVGSGGAPSKDSGSSSSAR